MIIAVEVLIGSIIILFLGWLMGRMSVISKSKDPVHNCKEFKKEGCSHVDGFLCDFDKCALRLEADIFELEQQLDVPMEWRYHNRHKIISNKYETDKTEFQDPI